MRGLREKELRINLLTAVPEAIDVSTPCHLANPREDLPMNGFAEPESMNAWNPQVAHRVELHLLEQVETMEDKVASASMQVKGWVLPQRDPDLENSEVYVGLIGVIRDRVLGLEAAIERRYLKPPLGTK